MPYEHKSRRVVRFAETDMAGIVHFSEFFKYMENAEHDFYRTLGLSVHIQDQSSAFGWPRVHASFDYVKPLRFEDEAEVHIVVQEISSKTILYRCFIRKVGEENHLCAKGSLRVICITKEGGNGRMRAANIPPFFKDKIEAAPEDYLRELEETR
ncbi:MAG: acyl-CoA thioesterase [Candidatus Omnitrophica bacterium]|nr:acyl-CoA thioesterase [Candidatus Omnitrophota bacterium]